MGSNRFFLILKGFRESEVEVAQQAGFSNALVTVGEHAKVILRWLVFAALADWIITRTLTRAAIFMPKSPVLIGVYQAVSVVGIVAGTFASLLAAGVLGWFAWRAWIKGARGLPFLTVVLLVLSAFFLFRAPGGWGIVIIQSVYLSILVALAWHTWRRREARLPFVASLFPMFAFAAGGLSHLFPAIYQAAGWSGTASTGSFLFNLGELFLVNSTPLLWWAYGRSANRRDWLLASLPAMAFTAFRLANPAMAGILAIWSMGLTLYLPWPAYAVSLWLAGVTVITATRRGGLAGMAILLLAAGGYAPQLSSQVFFGLVALWLLGKPEEKFLSTSAQLVNPADPVSEISRGSTGKMV